MFGSQLEMDNADRLATQQQSAPAGKGLSGGKGARHWTHQHISFNGFNQFALDLDIVCVEEMARAARRLVTMPSPRTKAAQQ